MRPHKVKPLISIIKVMVRILLISLCLTAVGYSQKEDINRLFQMLKDKDLRVRQKAAKTLGETKDVHAIKPLITALKDEDYDVTKEVAEALGKIGAPAIESLIVALKDEDRGVQTEAAWALGQIKDVRAIEPLIAALKEENPAVRWNAANAVGEIADALGEIKDGRAVEPLIATLEDTNSIVRYEAVEALGAIKDERAIQPLIAVIRNTAKTPGDLPYGRSERTIGDLSIRKEAREALANIGEPSVPFLIAALKDTESVVRKECARALSLIASGTLPSEEDVSSGEAVKALTTIARQANLEIVAASYEFFIKEGDPIFEPLLIEALNSRYGYARMAEDYLNCGNTQLEEAGRQWAKEHGYTIISGGGGGPQWGSRRE
jgi:HEAT repeat protein